MFSVSVSLRRLVSSSQRDDTSKVYRSQACALRSGCIVSLALARCVLSNLMLFAAAVAHSERLTVFSWRF